MIQNNGLAGLSVCLTALALSACNAAAACVNETPWVMAGQSIPDPSTNIVYNPTTNTPPGVLGAVASPYTVPPVRYLELTDMIGEKYNVSGTIVYAPFTGTTVPPASNNPFLFSLSTSAHSRTWHGSIKIAAGYQLNLLIMDTEPLVSGAHQTIGWQITGRLCDS